jgi:hypothetical protein
MKWLLFILCGFLLFGYSDALGEEWKFFSESEGSSFLFDAESVLFLSQNVVRVWVKVVVSEKDRSAWVAKGGEKYLNLRYIKSLLEINCKDKTQRSLSLELFSEQEILDSFKWEEARESSIPPGSNWDNLRRAICK